MVELAGDVKVEGFPRVQVLIKDLEGPLFKKVRREIIYSAHEIRNTMIKSMRDTPKTGNVYRRGKVRWSGGGRSGAKTGRMTFKKHIASSPGNPPAVDTGELVRSITTDAREFEIEVGPESGAPYAKFLEEGTGGFSLGRSGGSYGGIAPRPFLKPALDEHLPKIRDRVKAIILGGIKK